MLLADAMALQFSRPLFMIPLALLFLGEVAGLRRTVITLVGFAGIALYARPVTAGFDPGAFVGAAGALSGALIVICIKRLATTEPTRTIMFYYAISNAVFSLIPTIWLWVTPDWHELAMLVKQVGSHIPTIEILFFRSFIGFFFVLPMFIGNPWEPLRTQRFGMHFVRGVIGTLGNI